MTQYTIDIDRGNKHPLSVTLDLPIAKSRAYALFLHCFTSIGSKAHIPIINNLTKLGIGVLHFDISSIVQSNTTEPITVEDIEHICTYMSKNYFTPQLCIGHSLGTVALLTVIQQLPDVRALVAISSPSELSSFGSSSQSGDMFSKSTSAIHLQESTITLDNSLFVTMQKINIGATITKLAKPLLLLHAPEDSICPYWHVNTLFEGAHQPKSIISLHQSDHALLDMSTIEYASTMISGWVMHHLFDSTADNEYTENSKDSVVVSETGKILYQQSVSIGKHHFFTDEPLENNGNDSGPAPIPLLLAALGSCTSITIRMYALQKGWQLDHIQVELKQVNNTHSADSMIPSSQYFMREITLSGQLDIIQRNKLMDIANKCPVHKTLQTKVVNRLKFAGGTQLQAEE